MSENQPSKWTHYYQFTNGQPPRETTLKAIELFQQEPQQKLPFAIDLGCGTGRDAFELLRAGWRVLAMDKEAEALGWINYNGGSEFPFLETKKMGFEDLDLTGYSPKLINASASLPFCPAEHFDEAWGKIVDALQPGARFAGNLFGLNDTWAKEPLDEFPTVHHSEKQIRQYLKDFEIEYFVERDGLGTAVGGQPKNWHTFNIVAKKR